MNPSCDTRPTAPLHWQQHGEVVFFTLDAPPVNGLGLAVRQALMQALARAQAEASVRAIVLTGRPDCFCAGADVREFGTPRATTAPLLPDVIAALEASPKPVVAAIGGPCLGGGLELALGCHLRLAHPQARLGLPEVKLGLMPGAGGTQRLPRLLGLELAGRMIVQGEPLTAAELAGTPLLDGWLPQDAAVPQEATAWRLSILQALAPLLPKLLAQPPQAVSQRPVPGPEAHWQARVEALVQASPALRQKAARCCAEALADAAILPFAQGQRRERERFLALLASPESQALREAFAAERAAKKKPAG